jgi:hypothetical protein
VHHCQNFLLLTPSPHVERGKQPSNQSKKQNWGEVETRVSLGKEYFASGGEQEKER